MPVDLPVTVWRDRAECENAVRMYSAGAGDYIDEAVDVAMTERCNVWHACHVVYVRRCNDGRIPTHTCTLCGGRGDVRVGDHNLCKARASRGVSVFDRLDVVDGSVCPCSPCQTAIGGK